MLEGLDYPIERTDGYFDEQTETAVREFQEDHDLDETGQLDEATAQKIQEEIQAHIRDVENDAQLNRAIELAVEQAS